MIENRQYTAELVKSGGAGTDGLFVLNEETEDRVGDVISVDGWQLDQFQKNPIALWQHDADKPIGTWSNVRVDGKRLIGELKLATTNLARMAKQLIEDGVLRAVSVGFRALDWEPMEKSDGYLIKSAELLEVSLVSVPAHPSALLLSKNLGLSAQDRKLIFSPSQRERAPVVSDKSATVERARQDIAEMRALLKT